MYASELKAISDKVKDERDIALRKLAQPYIDDILAKCKAAAEEGLDELEWDFPEDLDIERHILARLTVLGYGLEFVDVLRRRSLQISWAKGNETKR